MREFSEMQPNFHMLRQLSNPRHTTPLHSTAEQSTSGLALWGGGEKSDFFIFLSSSPRLVSLFVPVLEEAVAAASFALLFVSVSDVRVGPKALCGPLSFITL